jgi:uncharacterized protein (TIGR01440 family)
VNVQEIGRQVKAAVEELLTVAGLQPGQILIVGCSTSEVQGAKIGSAGSETVAESILRSLAEACEPRRIALAIQCCEHLNRALVVGRQTMEHYRLEEVNVIPVAKAGGSLAAGAMKLFADPVVVEAIEAHAGIDIGNTMIGMHLKRVAVPVRLAQKTIGRAPVVAARTRPKLIGGPRAVYC